MVRNSRIPTVELHDLSVIIKAVQELAPRHKSTRSFSTSSATMSFICSKALQGQSLWPHATTINRLRCSLYPLYYSLHVRMDSIRSLAFSENTPSMSMHASISRDMPTYNLTPLDAQVFENALFAPNTRWTPSSTKDGLIVIP